VPAPHLKQANTGRKCHSLKLHRIGGFGEVSNIVLNAESPGKPPVSPHGTPVAISYLTFGVPPYFACRASGRGGPRNTASRESHEIPSGHIANLIRAALHADQIGLPFNRMITVHWEAAGVALEGMARATGRFIDLMTKTLARHGSKTAWLWVHENADGRGHDKGGHCHILVHIPAALVRIVTEMQRRWLRAITGQPYRKRVIKSDPIGGRLGLEASNPELHSVNLDAALAYVLKGASGSTAQSFGLDRREPGGRIIGKRCGTSQNIAAKARATQGSIDDNQ
jgi:hypothetical protein